MGTAGGDARGEANCEAGVDAGGAAGGESGVDGDGGVGHGGVMQAVGEVFSVDHQWKLFKTCVAAFMDLFYSVVGHGN